MGLALRRHLEVLQFQNAGAIFGFNEVFDEWPSYIQRYVPPAACVLPGSWEYGDWSFTPTLLEDTWEVRGEPGFGLYKLSELSANFEVSIRANSNAERSSLIQGIEESFVAPRLLMDDPAGARYGVFLPLPEYYGLEARFALLSARNMDTEDSALREHRDAVFVVSGQAPQVRVGPVFPLNLTIQLDPYC
jgi:hypothetical protein